MERNVSSSQLMQRHVQYFCRLAHPCADQHQCSSGKLPPLPDPAHLHSVNNVARRQHFGINQRMHSQFRKKLLVLGQEIFVVVYPGHGLLCSHTGSQHTSRHVAAFVGHYPDKQVGTRRVSLFQSADGCRRSVDSHQVKVSSRCIQLPFIFVHQNNVLLLSR